MNRLIDYIVHTKGYKLHTGSNNFSTMGDIGVSYKKGGSIISFGLHEYKKPPTLISPRPKINVHGDFEITSLGGRKIKLNIIDEQMDDAMSIVFSKFTSEQIFNAMFDDGITLIVNNNKE